MGLKFAPLGWIYHDGWDWNQTKTLLKSENGRTVEVDDSMHCHQRGHVHLFLPTVPFSPYGSSLAYWGEQTYHFEVKDEWGPNSDDPAQNQSVRLIGKPIWYVYVEEYWRRFYIQPWDMVDDTCKFPNNQEILYTQRGMEDYYNELISTATKTNDEGVQITRDLHKSRLALSLDNNTVILTELDSLQIDGRHADGTYWFNPLDYMGNGEEHSEYDFEHSSILGYNDYLEYMSRREARKLFIQNTAYATAFKQWLVNTYFSSCASVDENGDIIVTNRSLANSIIDNNNLLHTTTTTTDPETGYSSTTTTGIFTYPADGEDHRAFVTYASDRLIIEFLYARITYAESRKAIIDGVETTQTIETTVCYIDEFNEFYKKNAPLYNGYVNQIELLETYLKAYNLKLKDGCKYGDDNTILVPENRTLGHVGIRFDASKPCHSLGPFMEGGEFYFFNTVVNRTMPCEYWIDADKRTRQYFIKRKWTPTTDTNGGETWTASEDKYHFVWVPCVFADAEQLVVDYNVDGSYGSLPVHRLPNLYSAQNYVCNGMNAKRLKNDRSNEDGSSRNDVVLQNDYQDSAQVKSAGDASKPHQVIYTADGIEILPNEEGDITPHALNKYKWEDGGWTGWYESDETVKCSVDEKWYKRTWKPINYKPESRLWNREKRQRFPNPSPWLCDTNEPRYSSEPVTEHNPSKLHGLSGVRSHWCTTKVYDNDEANRIHLLHWEYALYFNLTRQYPQNFNGDEATLRRHFFMYATPSTNPSDNVYFRNTRISSGKYTPPTPYQSEGNTYVEGHVVTGGEPFGETAADIETLMEEYMVENGAITDIETENAVFADWLSTLGSSYFMCFEDRDIMWNYLDEYHTEKREITQADIRDGNMYVSRVDYGGNEILAPLPDPEFTVSYSSREGLYSYQTYLTFGEFRKVWTMLSQEEQNLLNGDMPQRNDFLFPTADDVYPNLDDSPSPYPQEETEFKRGAVSSMNASRDKEAMTTLAKSAFFPREDTLVRAENKRRQEAGITPLFSVSPLDEVGDSEGEPSDGTLAHVIQNGIPFDPYRNGTVNPIENWSQYFDHREEFTIPEGTTAGGDRKITNGYGSPNYPSIHPREMSYNHEDGARRHYPDDLFISPALEYQKIIRKDYERLPGKDDEEQFLQANWKTDKAGNWGDGFDITITIPWKENDEIQSPFSENDHVTRPIGEYCHECVKPENKMRYHLEFYDSLDQIRKFDFPNYVRLIHAFQKDCMPEGVTQGEGASYDYTKSFYKEDFNDYEKTLKLRENAKDENLKAYNLQLQQNGLDGYETWQKALDAYWLKINGDNDPNDPNYHRYIDRPIVRGYDCEGNEVTENAFEEVDGKMMWREQTTNLLPSIDKLEMTDEKVGYRDSKGNFVKGGGVVTFNDPYKEHTDGRWYEECLGAIVKAKCVLILEDSLGYRWKQVVDATALQPDQPIRGNDYRE